MTRTSSSNVALLACTVLSLSLACGCGGAVPINGGTADAAQPAASTDLATADLALDLSGYPLNGTYVQPVPAAFGCQTTQWTDFNSPATFVVVSTPTQVQVIYQGTVEQTWAVGDDGTNTGVYSQSNATFTITPDAQQDKANDIVLAATSTELSQSIPNDASTCSWARQ